MKVNVWLIIVDHIGTLRNNVSKKIAILDILLFYGAPVLSGIISYLSSIKVSQDFYNLSVTFFGIFVALLLNFQVAAFGIYNRRWTTQSDEKLSAIQLKELHIRRLLLKETNANISYLILISTVSIPFFLFLDATEMTGRLPEAIASVIYIHFILSLLMVVKRCHALFKREYDET